jgi:hypothetical protein
MRDSARPKAKANCVGCEAANLHQHLPGYEPDALAVKLQTNENGRIPRCCPGLLLLPRQASAAGSLVSDEKWTCAPGLHWVRRCCRPLARLFALRTMMKLGFSVGSAPTPSLPQREVLLLHHEKHLKCILRPDWLRLRKVALRAGNCRSAAGRSHRHGLVHNEEC